MLRDILLATSSLLWRLYTSWWAVPVCGSLSSIEQSRVYSNVNAPTIPPRKGPIQNICRQKFEKVYISEGHYSFSFWLLAKLSWTRIYFDIWFLKLYWRKINHFLENQYFYIDNFLSSNIIKWHLVHWFSDIRDRAGPQSILLSNSDQHLSLKGHLF